MCLEKIIHVEVEPMERYTDWKASSHPNEVLGCQVVLVPESVTICRQEIIIVSPVFCMIL